MNWEIIGATGEWAGAVAVVITLFYLAMQIKQNTKAMRGGTSFSVNDSLAKNLSAIRSDGEFAEIWLRGLRDLNSLDEVEQIRFGHHALEMLNLTVYIDQLEQQDLGDAHIDYIPWISVLYRDNPGFQAFVDSLQGGWSGSEELYRRIRNVEFAKGTNLYRRTE